VLHKGSLWFFKCNLSIIFPTLCHILSNYIYIYIYIHIKGANVNKDKFVLNIDVLFTL
jgi:type II secretory pathway component PulC